MTTPKKALLKQLRDAATACDDQLNALGGGPHHRDAIGEALDMAKDALEAALKELEATPQRAGVYVGRSMRSAR